jgi:hypothetical protein
MSKPTSHHHLQQLSRILSGLTEEKERMQSAFSEILLQTISPRVNENESQSISTDAHLLLFLLKDIVDCANEETLKALDSRYRALKVA